MPGSRVAAGPDAAGCNGNKVDVTTSEVVGTGISVSCGTFGLVLSTSAFTSSAKSRYDRALPESPTGTRCLQGTYRSTQRATCIKQRPAKSAKGLLTAGILAETGFRELLDCFAVLGLKIEIAGLADGVSAAGHGSLTSDFVDIAPPEHIKSARLDATWLPRDAGQL